MSEDIILSTEDLTKEFAGFVAVSGVNLRVARGTIHALIGPNGAGKTTCFNLLTKFLVPTKGQILFEGQDITNEKPAQIARRGVIRSFQISATFPHLTVMGNLLLGLEMKRSWLLGRLFGAARRAAIAQAGAMLETVGLAAARDRFPAQLSGGMQQRLSIAQAVITEPKILLLDEPFGALDPGITGDMHALILNLWREQRMTIFMISHDIQESFKLGTRLLTFDRLRNDPQAPEAYGAGITYDIPLRRVAA
jgi:NitT/TauT family transport system ATP-binding protein